MEINDKRLVNKLTKHEQTAYEEALLNEIHDSKDLIEETIIEHEPIKLLERINSKKNIKKQVSTDPEPTEHENT